MAIASAVDMVNLHRIGTLFCRLRKFWRWRRATTRLCCLDAVHHASRTASSKLVDGTNSIDGSVKGASGVEVLLDSWQKILFTFRLFLSKVCNPRMRERFVRCHTRCWINSQTAANKLASGQRNPAPVFERCKRVIGNEDSLHFLEVRIAVERRVAAKEKVCDDTNGPDVAVQMLVWWADI